MTSTSSTLPRTLLARFWWLCLPFAPMALGLVGACDKTEETGRERLAPMPDSFMNPMGLQAYDEMKTTTPISTNKALTAKVAAIAARIADATGEKLDWDFTLFDSKEVNAFCLPGGKVGVYTGIIPVAQTNAGLAAVLGHEVAHAILRHGGERASQQLALAGLLFGAEVTVDSVLKDKDLKPLMLAAIGLGAQLGVVLPFSREQEAEADTVGLKYMAKAGYDPQQAVELWHRMSALGGTPPEILSDHPDSDKRATALSDEQSDVLPLYDASQKQPTVAL